MWPLPFYLDLLLLFPAPPVLGEVSPSFLIQKVGETVDIFCEATGTPIPVLSWHKDGREIVPTDRITRSGSRVQVRRLVRTDAGVYACTFKNIVGQVSHVIKLVIEGEPNLVSFLPTSLLFSVFALVALTLWLTYYLLIEQAGLWKVSRCWESECLQWQCYGKWIWFWTCCMKAELSVLYGSALDFWIFGIWLWVGVFVIQRNITVHAELNCSPK